ncbi:hypothetical protein PHYBLDRAFT_141904 [Phycomyces blakesleeanus NRRL 1555(-)]|uniref:Tc1-like transposase DDE domain-containing protein n=1 Tax=Phycomyces blakesleeanus (strain ATCC 8743b / DSM 1359 / FGSC 10004 / NBRC 33097 / NRRL 1555) TaxID=763407 RepID=A0A163B343_PHYB8|nr:hypothetical protein PHYBLDRAFT_141904 [Phycomyces blakesleeanus NRRL 1555(-)]OAD78041.1 hypothetical protein PHYBLDRAFT_141904 [Phycomyces blakesleeanus NRRL 1555(-)]|eukprot:XP_018296081.1 hypothetical protein PHYBLDRAFT_141904 [Phycomyces blakesleeanus NRRL 1555(-)]
MSLDSQLRVTMDVLDCFWTGGFGPLALLEGNVNQEVYVDTLSQKFVSWVKNLSEKYQKDFKLQENGTSCHTGAYAEWWKETYKIKNFEYWPAQSPDLNLIEHVWWALEIKLSKVRASILNVNELKIAIQ